MNSSGRTIYRSSLWLAITAAALSLLLACGEAEAPTPTKAPAATATPTSAVTAASPTPTRVGPVATPTTTLVATPTPAGPAAEKARTGGHSEYTLGQYIDKYDYQKTSQGNGRYYALGKLYNQLLINYGGGKIECEVCSEWHLANSGKTMVFTLIPGIKFQNGKEMTSEDVKYSLRYLIGEVDGVVSARAGSLKEFVESIETPSKYEVRLNLVSATSSYMTKIMTVSNNVIYPAGTTSANLEKAPVGSGPYLLTEGAPGAATLKMVRNPNYFKPGLPYIDTITTAVVIDSTTRFAALLTHRVDITEHPTSAPVQFWPQLDKLKNEGKLSSYKFLIGSGFHGAFMPVTKPPFNNLKLRQAVNLAIDRRAYGDAIHNGRYLGSFLVYREADVVNGYGRLESQIWDVLPGWGIGAKKQQEIQQAKQLLADAGYPKGLTVPFMGTAADVYNELIQQQLEVIGIHTPIETTTSDIKSDRLLKQDYGISAFPYALGTGAPEEVIGNFWVTGGARNPTGYANPEVDKLYIQMSVEADPAKKAALYQQIAEIIILKDVAFAAVPSDIIEFFWWSRVQGVAYGLVPHPTAASGLMRGDRLWFKE